MMPVLVLLLMSVFRVMLDFRRFGGDPGYITMIHSNTEKYAGDNIDGLVLGLV